MTTMNTPHETQQPSNTRALYVLKDGDCFLVADASGDVSGNGDGLFRNDTRIISKLCLRMRDEPLALLSAAVSQDNVYFTAHLSNRPLPTMDEGGTPEGVIHVERKRFIYSDRLYERLNLINYSDQPARLPLSLGFAADFYDMFEVRGQTRAQRGERYESQLDERHVVLRYAGLDNQLRCSALSFSAAPARLDDGCAEFIVDLAAGEQWSLYLEVGAETAEPGQARFRTAAAQARRSMRQRRQRGARVRSSGRLFQSWLDKSRADLALLITDLPTGPYPYAGIPWFSTPFGRDAIFTALQTLWLDPSLARGVLAYLATHQAKATSSFRDSEPGKIMHETRKGEMSALNELPFSRYYGGVDTTPLFILLAGAYARRSGDRSFIESIWPSLESATGWIEQNISTHSQGLLGYARGEASGLLNQGWKDSHDSVFHADGRTPDGPIALVEVQGYAYRAFMSMSEMAAWRGNVEQAAHWRACAERVRAAVETHFWQDDMQFYALALDGAGESCRVRTSNAAHLLYCGLAERSRGRALGKQLLSRAFNSGWGVRTLASEAARFNPMSYHNGSVWPHDVALCAAGLARYGEREGVVRVLEAMFEATVHFGMRLPELFCGFERSPGEPPISYPVACLPQAWAAGSVFMLLQACLGLEIDAHRQRIIIKEPRLPAGIDSLQVQQLAIGEQRVDLAFKRLDRRVVALVEAQHGPKPVTVEIHL